MIYKTSALLALPLLLCACVDGPVPTDKDDTDSAVADSDTEVMDTEVDTDDTMDTEVVDVTPSWDTSGWTNGWGDAVTSCANNVVTIQLLTENWGYMPELYLVDTRFSGSWEESHSFTESDTSADETGYSEFTRSLNIVGSFANQEPDVSTIFGCDDFNQGESNQSVTFAAVVYDADDAIADCIVFGHNAAGLLDGSFTGIEAAISKPGWLNSTNCRNAN